MSLNGSSLRTRGTVQDPRLTSEEIRQVAIRPGVNILAVLKHLEYKPWYALAEYVDNAVQSYIANAGNFPKEHALTVRIEIDKQAQLILISDNAAGISKSELERAFRAADAPLNANGLCEFGMGMKSASCWFAPTWTVRTRALGEGVTRTIRFNLEQIVENDLERLDVHTNEADDGFHGTEVLLQDVYHVPQGATLGKIREHLRDIYRCFLRDGTLQLEVAGEWLAYEEPEFLSAPEYNVDNEPEGPAKDWRKEIAFDLSDGRRVTGFAGILSKGDTKRAGLSLFRRNRAVVGTGDQKFRPDTIFGGGNSYESQRVHGELHLHGFAVSHTKDGVKWGDAEEEFLEKLRLSLDALPLPLLRQARNFRSGRPSKNTASEAVRQSVDSVTQALQKHVAADVEQESRTPVPDPPAPTSLTAPAEPLVEHRTFNLEAAGNSWVVTIELAADARRDWLELACDQDVAMRTRSVALRVCLGSPFMSRIVRLDQVDSLEPVLRIAAAVGLSEVLARLAGEKGPGAVRRHMNSLLASSLSHKKG